MTGKSLLQVDLKWGESMEALLLKDQAQEALKVPQPH